MNETRAKRNTSRKRLDKKIQTVIVIKSTHDAKDNLFPEKVAKANEMLSKVKYFDPKLFK